MSQARDPSRVDTASIRVPAAPTRVYEALMDRDRLLQWLPPDGMTARIEDFDASIGGGYRMTLTYADAQSTSGKTTSRSDVVKVRFVQLEPARRVAQDVFFESPDPDYAEPMRMTWDLASEREGTRVTVACRNVPIGISPEDHAQGLRESLANLVRFLRERGAATA